MTTFPLSPRVLKGGIVLLDPERGAVIRIIVLQYNPETIRRSFTVQAVGGDGADRSEALRLKGPPTEAITIAAEIDATDQLEFPEQNATAVELGIQPQLAALETMIYPSALRLRLNQILSFAGTLEIAAAESPLTLFVFSRNRIVPVRITELTVNEEAFDPHLNPIRAKVDLGMRVLTVNDFPAAHAGAGIFMAYLEKKESLAARFTPGTVGALGLARV
jgi:hypothetical protein